MKVNENPCRVRFLRQFSSLMTVFALLAIVPQPVRAAYVPPVPSYEVSELTDGTYQVRRVSNGGIIATSTTDVAVCVNAALNDTVDNAPLRGANITFTANEFTILNPIVIPAANDAQYYFSGLQSASRTYGTILKAGTTFPTNRYMFECVAAVGSNKRPCMDISGFYLYNPNFATINIGGIKYESDRASIEERLAVKQVVGNYLWRGLHVIGPADYFMLKNITFYDANAAFIGDRDFIFEQGEHAGKPSYGTCTALVSSHSGTMTNAFDLACTYCRYFNISVISGRYTEAPIKLAKSWSNDFYGITVNATAIETSEAAVLFDAVDSTNPQTYDNHLYDARAVNCPYALKFKNNALRNYIKISYYEGFPTIHDAGHNSTADTQSTIVILPGLQPVSVVNQPITSTNSLVRIIDER
ncbi:MAG: hypothetical protein PHT33_02375 [bacterium]|nr:hypothetical protein [bacterium]